MLFDSSEFLIFFGAVFVVHHLFERSFRTQNALLILASFIFYGWWDWRFLGLIVLSAMVDFFVGLQLGKTSSPKTRRALIVGSVVVNLGVLGFFKYFNFFAESLVWLLGSVGGSVDHVTLRIILPVGISFYTFQSMAYSIDVYRGRIEPEKNAITYLAYIAFFPQLVAGPIERAEHLLTQFNRPRSLDSTSVKTAIWLLSWGFFLKLCLADTAGSFVGSIFQTNQGSGWMTILGTLFFAVQIYCDFNAYSLIAKGVAALLGFELSWNFDQPYLALNVREFWQRWHISLSTWLRDYLYIPLGGSRHGRVRTAINLMLTMSLGGLWHGASWNFVLWGALHGAALIVHRAWTSTRLKLPTALAWSLTIAVVCVGWFLFRCEEWDVLVAMVRSLDKLRWNVAILRTAASFMVLILPLLVAETWFAQSESQAPAVALAPLQFGLLTGSLAFAAWLMFDRFRSDFVYFQF